MAGAYPDVPSRRMAYDADGSVVAYWATDVVVTEYTGQQRTDSNSEETQNVQASVSGVSGQFLGVIFPELREIDGMYVSMVGDGSLTDFNTSGDTTSFLDGTWTQRIGDVPESSLTYTDYRDEIQPLAVSSVRAVRQGATRGGGGSNWRQLHLYGDITPGQTPDRLLFIDEATGVEFTAAVDFGDVPRGGSEDLEWRIKNNSASLTATTIQYAASALYLGSSAWYTHTLPGGATYQGTRQVASIGPSTTSAIIKTRRITPADETTGPHVARISLNVDTWS